MTFDQIAVLGIFISTIFILLLDKIRYDLVVILSLIAVSATTVLSPTEIFSGFGHPAVFMVLSMFIISRGIANSGAVNKLVKVLKKISDKPRIQLGVITSISTLVSGVINNAGTTAIFMPPTIDIAKRTNVSVSKFLIPLSYSTLLGGAITLLGTPSNIVVATFREEVGLSETSLFEYAPLAITIAVIGMIFVWVIGWYLLPDNDTDGSEDAEFDVKDYITEVKVSQASNYIGKRVKELESLQEYSVTIIAISRNKGERLLLSGEETIVRGDVLLIRIDSKNLEDFLTDTEFELEAEQKVSSDVDYSDLELREVVVPPNSYLIGKSAKMLNLRMRYGINLLAISHKGGGVIDRLSDIKIRAGDILLFQGMRSGLQENLKNLEAVPLKEREITLGYSKKVIYALLIILGMIILSVYRILPLPMVFLGSAVLFVITKLVSVDEVYKKIDWPVIVLMGAMISITQAVEKVGLFDILSSSLLHSSLTLSPMAVLAIILFSTILLSNLLDNSVVAVIMSPISINLAISYSVSIEPFLAAVLIGSVSAFIIPFGEQPNILVMARAGYKFGDYFKIGAALSVLVYLASLPLIVTFWPL